MNMKSLTALSVAILVLAGGTSAYSAEPTPKSSQASKEAMKKAAMKKAEAKKKAEAMKKEAMKKEADKMGMIKGSYSDYDASKLSNAEHGTVILFFNATWCPTCVAANKNFNGSTPPDGLTVLKVDYDDSTDLKRKYGVTYQHTFVQVDKTGKLIKKWNGSKTYDELISNKA